MSSVENDGLWDLPTFDSIADLIHSVLQLDEKTVRERLYREAIETGVNVCAAAREMSVVPHVFNERMLALYSQSDAFVFELFVSHALAYSRKIDSRVSQLLNEHCNNQGGASVLCFGDGIGCDSLRLAAIGFKVTYFEFDGFSARVAKKRFENSGYGNKIEIVHKPEDLAEKRFDALVCREVLEHVPDPVLTIKEMGGLLRPGGIAIITESFRRVTPEFPTHLTANIKFAGHVVPIFVRQGFSYRSDYEGSPYVFLKRQSSANSSRAVWILNNHLIPKIIRGFRRLTGSGRRNHA